VVTHVMIFTAHQQGATLAIVNLSIHPCDRLSHGVYWKWRTGRKRTKEEQ